MIYIMAHKPFDVPDLPGYVPLQVGAALHDDLGWLRDDTGDNISSKNPCYCELTGMYWVWKNRNDDVKGIVHYRRYFTRSQLSGTIVPYKQLENDLKNVDVVLPCYFYQPTKTNGEQMVPRYCEEKYLQQLRDIMSQRCPEDLNILDSFLDDRRGYFFNMLVASRERFDDYCAWLFDILFTLEININAQWPQDDTARVYGFISERLLNVYLLKNKLSVQMYPVTLSEWNFLRRARELYRSTKKSIRYRYRKSRDKKQAGS